MTPTLPDLRDRDAVLEQLEDLVWLQYLASDSAAHAETISVIRDERRANAAARWELIDFPELVAAEAKAAA